jgi:hypothetical protein
MLDQHVVEAVLRRISDQAPDERSRVKAIRLDGGQYDLVNSRGRQIGTMRVAQGRITLTCGDDVLYVVPTIPDRALTEGDIDNAATVILEKALA